MENEKRIFIWVGKESHMEGSTTSKIEEQTSFQALSSAPLGS